ncbi:MAG: citrate lyase acyl carrier protein [Muribaculaceae bacterium]|nr:citrate lyase acyl carrier protein [Muribaculaceae bacterium]
MNLKNSHAGTLESGDILIQISPSDKDGLDISLDSTVAYQFGDRIKEVIRTTAEELGLKSANIHATDKGALDCTIKARTAAAVVRATGVDVWKD